MASLTLVGGQERFSWEITGLSVPFNSSNYIDAGITENTFTQEATSITGVVDSVNATSTGTSTSVGGVNIPYPPGTYTFYAFARAQNGKYYQAGSATVTVTAAPPVKVRPSNWSWQSSIGQNTPIEITATEWNNFCSKINAFRGYKDLSSYNFTAVSKGTAISAAIVNQARSAISSISGHGTLPTAAVQNGTITASFFLGLQSALNSIS